MFKCILLLVIASSTAHGQDSLSVRKPTLGCRTVPDQWFAQDKFLHFSACAAITGLTYHFYVNRLNRGEDRGKVYAISLTCFVGIGKELYDKKRKGRFSWKDLCWDGLGLAAGYFLFVHEF
jgi:uncharacterized protein YfiM (DUF2279 family)